MRHGVKEGGKKVSRRCEMRGERIRQTEATEMSERQVVREEVGRGYVRS